MQGNGMPPLMTPAEFADATRSNVTWVRRACREGRIRSVKVGRKWLIPTSQLQDERRWE